MQTVCNRRKATEGIRGVLDAPLNAPTNQKKTDVVIRSVFFVSVRMSYRYTSFIGIIFFVCPTAPYNHFTTIEKPALSRGNNQPRKMYFRKKSEKLQNIYQNGKA